MAIFYHRTTEEAWKKIQKEGYLWGSRNPEQLAKTVSVLKEKGLTAISDGENVYRYTYLAPFDWGDSYGTVLLEVRYEPKRKDFGVKHNYGFDPPQGQICTQFSVFEPIPLTDVRRIVI
jgi:hypothetical protein